MQTLEQLADGDLRAEMQALLRDGLMTQEEYDEAVADLGADVGAGRGPAAVGAGDGGMADSSSSDDGGADAEGAEDDDLIADLRSLLASGDMTQGEFDEALADMGATDV